MWEIIVLRRSSLFTDAIKKTIRVLIVVRGMVIFVLLYRKRSDLAFSIVTAVTKNKKFSL